MPAPGYKRVHKVCRKVVPKRNVDKKTASGLLRWYAYEADVTREELAAAAGITKQYVNKMLITAPKTLRPHFITIFAAAIGLTREELVKVHRLAAKEAGYLIGD